MNCVWYPSVAYRNKKVNRNWINLSHINSMTVSTTYRNIFS